MWREASVAGRLRQIQDEAADGPNDMGTELEQPVAQPRHLGAAEAVRERGGGGRQRDRQLVRQEVAAARAVGSAGCRAAPRWVLEVAAGGVRRLVDEARRLALWRRFVTTKRGLLSRSARPLSRTTPGSITTQRVQHHVRATPEGEARRDRRRGPRPWARPGPRDQAERGLWKRHHGPKRGRRAMPVILRDQAGGEGRSRPAAARQRGARGRTEAAETPAATTARGRRSARPAAGARNAASAAANARPPSWPGRGVCSTNASDRSRTPRRECACGMPGRPMRKTSAGQPSTGGQAGDQ